MQVFICGATGTQGSRLAAHLSALNIEMHALSRSPNASVPGVTFHHGSYSDVDTLRSAMQGCTALFLNLSPDFADSNAERKTADTILTQAKEAGIQHVVYSSSVGTDDFNKLSHFNPDSFVGNVLLSKRDVEEKVRTAGFKYWTILRPGTFMQNYIKPLVGMYPGLAEEGKHTTALKKDTELALVDAYTIGLFAKSALLDPDSFHAQNITIADQLTTLDTVFDKLAAATGRSFEATYLSDQEAEAQRASNPFLEGQLMMRDTAKTVDLEQIKAWNLPLSSFDAFLAREADAVKATYLGSNTA